jgi:hypothetical protein
MFLAGEANYHRSLFDGLLSVFHLEYPSLRRTIDRQWRAVWSGTFDLQCDGVVVVVISEHGAGFSIVRLQSKIPGQIIL